MTSKKKEIDPSRYMFSREAQRTSEHETDWKARARTAEAALEKANATIHELKSQLNKLRNQ